MTQEIENDLLEIEHKMKQELSGSSRADKFLQKHFEKTNGILSETGIFLVSYELYI